MFLDSYVGGITAGAQLTEDHLPDPRRGPRSDTCLKEQQGDGDQALRFTLLCLSGFVRHSGGDTAGGLNRVGHA